MVDVQPRHWGAINSSRSEPALASRPATDAVHRLLIATLRSELIDPAIAAHPGRIIKRAGDRNVNRNAERLQIREVSSWNITQAVATCC